MSNADNFRRFAADVRAFVRDEAPEAVQRAQARIGLDALEGVQRKTPVDTGFARNSWFAALGQEPSDDATPGRSDDGAAPSQAGLQVVFRPGALEPLYISNNAVYINKLEDGSSQQAPNGMVAVTLAELSVKYARIDDA